MFLVNQVVSPRPNLSHRASQQSHIPIPIQTLLPERKGLSIERTPTPQFSSLFTVIRDAVREVMDDFTFFTLTDLRNAPDKRINGMDWGDRKLKLPPISGAFARELRLSEAKVQAIIKRGTRWNTDKELSLAAFARLTPEQLSRTPLEQVPSVPSWFTDEFLATGEFGLSALHAKILKEVWQKRWDGEPSLAGVVAANCT